MCIKQYSNLLNVFRFDLLDSSRILFATWWIYTVILTAFYTANLTAFMTFNGLNLPILSVNDIQKYEHVTWLANMDGALAYYIEVKSQHLLIKST